jgi:hypothetical protein
MSRPLTPLDASGPAASRRAAFRQLLPRLMFGFFLAAVGVVFTLDNLDLVDSGDVFYYWPVMLLLLGIGLVLSSASAGEAVGGAIWMLIGGGLLLYRLDVIPYSLWDFWPLVLVLFGGLMVFRAVRPRVVGADENSTVHAFAMMSGVTRKIASVAFEGGSLTAIMGGIEVDLRGARMVRQQAVVDCFAMWGGIEIQVPPGWTVSSRVWPLMGGFEDKTTPPAPEDITGELVISGLVTMGGITVKS